MSIAYLLTVAILVATLYFTAKFILMELEK
jgi:hypothetical protein